MMRAESSSLFVNAGADISEDGLYRYSLFREWGNGARILWLMLNPSTADAYQLDNTLRRVTAYTEGWGFRRFDVGNLFAWRSTDPQGMKEAADPVGPRNDSTLLQLVERAAITICAWGTDGVHLGRDRAVLDLLAGKPLHCLKITKDGHPSHPLYLDGSLRPTPWTRN